MMVNLKVKTRDKWVWWPFNHFCMIPVKAFYERNDNNHEKGLADMAGIEGEKS